MERPKNFSWAKMSSVPAAKGCEMICNNFIHFVTYGVSF